MEDNGPQLAQCHLYSLSTVQENVPSASNREASGRNSGLAVVACLFLYHLGASGMEEFDCPGLGHVPSTDEGGGKASGKD